MKQSESKFKETSIPLVFAYWINPTGKILPLIDYTDTKAMMKQHKLKYADVKIDSPSKVINTSFTDMINDFKSDESMDDFKFTLCETVDDLL